MNSTLELDERGIVMSCPKCGGRNRLAYDRLGQTFRCGKCQNELKAPGEPIDVKTEQQFELLKGGSALPILVDFWAAWCGPCKMVAPELVKVAAQGKGQWLVAKVNTEELPGVAQRFQISGIPTLVLLKGHQELGRQSGAMPAPTIIGFLQQYLGPSKGR